MTVAPIATPYAALTLSGNPITTAQTLSVSVGVSDGNAGDQPPSGTVTITSASYTSGAVLLDRTAGATVTIPAGTLPIGTGIVTAAYTPDAASSALYTAATGSAFVAVVAPPVPNFTIGGAALSVAPGATTGNTSTITVTPSGGFTGSVTLTAAITSSPNPVTITAGPATATLTVSTTAPTTASLNHPAGPTGNWYASGGAVLACVVIWGIPAGKRKWKRCLLGMFALAAVAVSGITACGGGSPSTTNQGHSGTTAGIYSVTVTATLGSTTQTTGLTLSVQ